MAALAGFTDWYRPVNITPTDGILQKRWSGIESLLESQDKARVIELVKLFIFAGRVKSISSDITEAFRKFDEGFPSRDNQYELSVLAGACIHKIIVDNGQYSTLAAMALSTGVFGMRNAAQLEQDHINAAQRHLAEESKVVRNVENPQSIKMPNLSKKRFDEALPKTLFDDNQLSNIALPLTKALAESGKDISAAFVQAQESIAALERQVKSAKEELDILWWLQTQVSRDLHSKFDTLGGTAGTIILAKEAADISQFVPGPPAIQAAILKALTIAGIKKGSQKIALKDAINAVPRSWKEVVSNEPEMEAVKELVPISLAIATSLSTDGENDWLPVFKKICDVPLGDQHTAVEIAFQYYNERMLFVASLEIEE